MANLKDQMTNALHEPGGAGVTVGFDGQPITAVMPTDTDFAVAAWMGRAVAFVDSAAERTWKFGKDVNINSVLQELAEIDPLDVFAINLIGVGASSSKVKPFWLLGVRCRWEVIDTVVDVAEVVGNGEVVTDIKPGNLWQWKPEDKDNFVTIRMMGDAPRAWAEQEARWVDKKVKAK